MNVFRYFWDRLIRGTDQVDAFRRRFGDERQDYGQALHRHHQRGAQVDWAKSFISTYASAHPWEDWAETWAYYLHITDTLETALLCGLWLRPRRSNEPDRSGPNHRSDRAGVGRFAIYASHRYLRT